jgi:arabinofuranosyltransferase
MKKNREAIRPFIVLFAFLGIVVVATVVRLQYALSNPTLDDAYITFRYIRNVARGVGFVFNPGERVLGTTTPLFVMGLTPFAIVGADVLAVAKIITISASVVNVILVFWLARRLFGDISALLAAFLLTISTSSVWAASTGMETELNVLLLLATTCAYFAGRLNLFGVLAALAFLMRPDDLILITIIFLHHTFQPVRQKHLRNWARPWIVFALTIFPWIIFALLYFGSPIPNSIVGKASSYRVPVLENWTLYREQFGFALGTPRALVSTALFLVGLVYIARRPDYRLIIPTYFITYSLAFVVTGARLGSGWYWQPLWPFYCLIFGAGICWIKDNRIWNSTFTRVRTPVIAAIFLIIILVFGWSIKVRFFDSPPPRDDVTLSLESAGQWIGQNTPINATIALESIGAVGWFSDRYILDEGGLVSPQVAKINARIGKPDFFSIIHTFQPDYYLAWQTGESQVIVESREQKDWFEQHYQYVRSFGTEQGPVFILFKETH